MTEHAVARSYSQYHSYTACAKAYEYEKVQKIPQPPAVWFAAGTAYHETTEAYDRNDERAQSPDQAATWFQDRFDELLDEYRREEPDETRWRTAGRKTRDKPNGEDADWWRGYGVELVQKYIDWRQAEDNPYVVHEMPDGSPAIEVGFTLDFGGVLVRGAIDRILRDRHTGALLAADLKTGPRDPVPIMQLGTYAVAFGQITGEPVFYGAYFMARAGRLTAPVDMDGWTFDKVAAYYGKMDRREREDRETGLYLPTTGMQCGSCPFRPICPAFSNAAAMVTSGVASN